MKSKKKLYQFVIFLAIITVGYNFIEGITAVYFGLDDEILTLFGFGLDSFVEVISGIGIWHMVLRIRNCKNEQKDNFEKRALQITGISFYLLTLGLITSAIYNFISGAHPETTFWIKPLSTLPSNHAESHRVLRFQFFRFGHQYQPLCR